MINLTHEEILSLRAQHKKEHDRRICDRIKAVILSNQGWSNEKIAEALLLHVDTISDHLKEFEELKKLSTNNGGSSSQLNAAHTLELINHIESYTYVKVKDLAAYIKTTYQISFSVPGLTKWLHRNNFSYKQPKGVPAKADPEKQQEFIKKYEDLMAKTLEDEPVVFGDVVHPTMATKISCGWIRTGQAKLIKTTASRTRMNIFGSLNLEDMKLVSTIHETIDSTAMEAHFEQLSKQYPEAKTIHLILDQGPYNTSKETKKSAEKYRITLHYLPPYSPNLNPIERVWKIMNEHVRNNIFFKKSKDFFDAIHGFFKITWPAHCHEFVDRVNDNFETISFSNPLTLFKSAPSG